MTKFKEGFSSERFYPDSDYLLNQYNTNEGTPVLDDQKSSMGEIFEWPDSYWFIAERTNGRLAMIGLMAVIINYGLFGWIAYPIL